VRRGDLAHRGQIGGIADGQARTAAPAQPGDLVPAPGRLSDDP
jgi:hypothetical protein